jgi:poly-gamma-glutamate synthesis protein (capsule biosynthesis protein)
VITLFLTGDVMTGRGIDQVLASPSDPALHESYVRDARDYVALAERVNGRIRRPVGNDYVWGAALAELERVTPDARIVNLETSVTRSDAAWPSKGIHYRMHPNNVGCLTAARLDCCVLANNHVLDFGYAGLEETLATLRGAGLRTAGAGAHARAAAAPAGIDLGARGRVLVFAYGAQTSGIPLAWSARDGQPGLNVLREVSAAEAQRIGAAIARERRPNDVVVVSVHWGDNWGYPVPREHRDFARALIDSGSVDVVHGHSSHHAKGLEVYRGRLILYGCGDFINDYEGIGGYERYRSDLAVMYFATLDPARGLTVLRLVPLRVRRFRLEPATHADAGWLKATLERESPLDRGFELVPDGSLRLTVTE